MRADARFLWYNQIMLIPRIMPDQIKNEPDQVCKTLNALIDIVNDLQRQR